MTPRTKSHRARRRVPVTQTMRTVWSGASRGRVRSLRDGPAQRSSGSFPNGLRERVANSWLRSEQAAFVCQRCGHTQNADENAARVIKQRGIQVVLSGKWRESPPKQTMRLKCKSVGPERPKRVPAIDTRSQEPAPTEIHIRHGRDRTQSAHGLLNPETPATARSA